MGLHLRRHQATQLLGESKRHFLWKVFYYVSQSLFSFAFFLNFEIIALYALCGQRLELEA